MPTLLVIESSPRAASVSTSLTQKFTQEWQLKNPDGKVITRNVFNTPASLVSEPWIAAAFTPVGARSGEQKAALAESDSYIAELVEADTIVIGAPMHNFAISSPLKAYIDQIVRPGRTFSIGPDGYKGLLDSKKKVIVASARGGDYSTDLAFLDHQTPYLKAILGFLGLTDVNFAYANNQSRSPEAVATGVKAATEQILAHV
jgi:FMN-dependent NADH-azoreductase